MFKTDAVEARSLLGEYVREIPSPYKICECVCDNYQGSLDQLSRTRYVAGSHGRVRVGAVRKLAPFD
jgi:hypothetical protein